MKTMLAIRGILEKKTLHVIPQEPTPRIEKDVPVAIVFLDETATPEKLSQYQREIALRMLAERDSMPPLDVDLKTWIEEGREH
jgi:hypothetical protein